MVSHGTDTHHYGRIGAGAQGRLHRGGDLIQLPDAGAVRELADKHHIPLADAQDKVALAVREQGLDNVGGNRLALLQRADHEHAPCNIRGDAQLLGPHIDIAQHDVIGNDVLDEGTAVMLLLIIGLGGVEGNGSHSADGTADLIITKGEGSIVKLVAPAAEGLEGLSIGGDHGVGGVIDDRNIFRPALADHGQFAAGADDTLTVDDANGAVGIFFQLEYHILKNSARHSLSSLFHSPVKNIVQFANSHIISSLLPKSKKFLVFSTKNFFVFWAIFILFVFDRPGGADAPLRRGSKSGTPLVKVTNPGAAPPFPPAPDR